MTLLYPYPHQIFALVITTLILFILWIPVHAFYSWLKRRLTDDQVKKLKARLVIAAIALGIFLFAGGGITLVKIHQVNEALGFRYATPELPEGEPFLITRVEYGKAMHEAGLRENDRVQMGAVNDLYALLINNQRREVEFEVKREEEIMTIKLVVPEMDTWEFRLLPFARF
jgi:hypothetical protein